VRRALHEVSVYFGLDGRSAQMAAPLLPLAVTLAMAVFGGAAVGFAFSLSRGALSSAVIGALIAASIAVIGIRDRRLRGARGDATHQASGSS
jgi:hypothetical protein